MATETSSERLWTHAEYTMSKVFVTESYLDDIADAIRGKNGTENTYKPSQMAAAITALPDSAVLDDKTITANGTYDPSDAKYVPFSVITFVPVTT